MRLVTIDNGNTNPTVAFHNNGVIQEILPLDQYTVLDSDFILISSVGKAHGLKPSFDLKKKRTKTHFFDMKVDYSETLGDDRLIAAYGVYKKLKSDESALVIDAGTFMTCDLVTSDGFQGGYIFPGINRFLKTYSESAQLPHLKAEQLFKVTQGLPHSTDEAILKATEIYLKASILEIIKMTSPGQVIFSGGSASELKKFINLEVRSDLDRHLVHSALSLIHQLHLDQE